MSPGSSSGLRLLSQGVPFVAVVVGGAYYLSTMLSTQIEVKDKVTPATECLPFPDRRSGRSRFRGASLTWRRSTARSCAASTSTTSRSPESPGPRRWSRERGSAGVRAIRTPDSASLHLSWPWRSLTEISPPGDPAHSELRTAVRRRRICRLFASFPPQPRLIEGDSCSPRRHRLLYS